MNTRVEVETALDGCGDYCPIFEIVRGPDINLGSGKVLRTYECKHVDVCVKVRGVFEKSNNDG